MIDVWAPEDGENAGSVFVAGTAHTPDQARELARQLLNAAAFAEEQSAP